MPAAILLLALLALSVDCTLSQWFIEACPSWIKRVLQFCELFGHGFGVVVVVVLIHQLDPARRWAIPRVATVSLVAGLAADVVKLLVGRIRPYRFDLDSSVLKSFDGWLPLIAPSSCQSLPSAHTATAMGLAMVLIWLYPQGRRLFPTLAVLVALQRLACGAHYLSDVLTGAALGIVVGLLFLKSTPLADRFARWESRSRLPSSSA
jgi:membrane-associated phospholipid phosphatase